MITPRPGLGCKLCAQIGGGGGGGGAGSTDGDVSSPAHHAAAARPPARPPVISPTDSHQPLKEVMYLAP